MYKRQLYVQLKSEPTLFVKKGLRNGVEFVVFVLVYVDDLIFMGNNTSVVQEEIDSFLKKFEGTDAGELSFYLGVKIERSEKCLYLSQIAYIDWLLEYYNMANCNAKATPMTENWYDEMYDHSNDAVIDDGPFRHLVGCLLFLATRTRGDILLATSILALSLIHI